jgi:hypothetical protein
MIGELHAPAAGPPGRRFRYQLNRGLARPQSRLRRFGGEKHFLVLLAIEPRLVRRPERSRVTKQTTPYH